MDIVSLDENKGFLWNENVGIWFLSKKVKEEIRGENIYLCSVFVFDFEMLNVD